MIQNDPMNDPNVALAAPAAPAGGQMSDLQRMKLMQAMQGMNAHQQPATTAGAATANALAQGLNGYMQAMQLQKMNQGGAAAPVNPMLGG